MSSVLCHWHSHFPKSYSCLVLDGFYFHKWLLSSQTTKQDDMIPIKNSCFIRVVARWRVIPIIIIRVVASAAQLKEKPGRQVVSVWKITKSFLWGFWREKLFELKAGSDLPTCVQSRHVAPQHPGDESYRCSSDDGEIMLQHQWPASNNLWNDILSCISLYYISLFSGCWKIDNHYK